MRSNTHSWGRRKIESTEEGKISREVREATISIQMANLEALPYCDIKTKERPAQPRLWEGKGSPGLKKSTV